MQHSLINFHNRDEMYLLKYELNLYIFGFRLYGLNSFPLIQS
jgi:hypothetical protein